MLAQTPVERPRMARKVGMHHFAFFRGHIEGLDLALIGDRYLETGPDLRKAKATVRWIRDELVAAAKRQKPEVIRLLKITPSRLGLEAPSPAPSLEEFQDAHDPDGFYTENELLKLFQEHYGTLDKKELRKASRNERLRRRLIDAVRWLEQWVASEPLPDDPLVIWLDNGIAGRLLDVRISTVKMLTELIAKRGKNWHKAVPGMGSVGAERVQRWLQNNDLLPREELLPATRAEIVTTGEANPNCLVPLEALNVAETFSGSHGTNRAYSNKLAARNDREAIEAWLRSLGDQENTVRSYRAQAERFLLWMIFERQKPLSSATTEDCIAYRDFLIDIGRQLTPEQWQWRLPRTQWVGTARSVPRWSEDWRPFNGPLASSSQRLAQTILTGLCEWLARQKYLDSNPWDGVSKVKASGKIRADHSLTVTQWQAVIASCEARKKKDEAYFRLRFALLVAYGMGFRLEEIAQLRVALRLETRGEVNPGLTRTPDGDWDIVVLGKGSKERSVPVPRMVMEALVDYMEVRGEGRDPSAWKETTPLLASLRVGLQFAVDGGQTLSNSAVARLFGGHFKSTAATIEDPLDGAHLLRASTHWLRHTHATHALEAGAEIEEVQENLGHASVATTAIYSHTTRKRRKSAVEKLMDFSTKD